jgi:hypothetical protein
MYGDVMRIEEFEEKGKSLLDIKDPQKAREQFDAWVDEVGQWLQTIAPDSDLYTEWEYLGGADLVAGNRDDNVHTTWWQIRMAVNKRLFWLSRFLNDSAVSLSTLADDESAAARTETHVYVDPMRIDQLKSISSKQFDLSRLIRLCEELNINFTGKCCLGTIMITRAILDHVPPIFGCSTFSAITADNSGSGALKQAVQNLSDGFGKIAGRYLDRHIKDVEPLPAINQVDFSEEIDILLMETAARLSDERR